MELGALTFLSPSGGLVALAVVVPIAALLVAERRVSRARAVLRLAAPGGEGWRAMVVALAAIPLLLGLAASQPAVRTHHGTRLCTDGRFPTADGRASFTVVAPPDAPPDDGRLRLATRRGKQFNTMVMGERDPLTGATRDAVFVAEEMQTLLDTARRVAGHQPRQ